MEWVDFDIPEDDKELMLTLSLVGTMVVLLHAIFEYIYWRETQGCMPCSPDDPSKPWDPRTDKLPMGIRWFGLPSMWFTSRQAYNDLMEWISFAKGVANTDGIISGIYPQEMAIFALDPERCKHMRSVLRHSKLYDAFSGDFLTGSGRGQRTPVKQGECPLELDLELVFFDSLQHVDGQQGVGEFLQPDDEYQTTHMSHV